jgi:hypothetical protein
VQGDYADDGARDFFWSCVDVQKFWEKKTKWILKKFLKRNVKIN